MTTQQFAVYLTGHAVGLIADGRFRHWTKLICSRDHIDLKGKKGYALTGPFKRWGDHVPLAAGEFVVFAAETGSRARRSYEYRLARVTDAGELEVIPISTIEATVYGAELPAEVHANAHNSDLALFAAYAWVEFGE